MKHQIIGSVKIGFILAVALTVGLVIVGFGQAQQSVTINGAVTQRLIFSIQGGESVTLAADPVDNPTVEAESSFQVKTNVYTYAISANFGSFVVEDTDYGLIANENFKIRSIPTGEGDPIANWTVPSEEMSIVSGEDGLTNGESTVVNGWMQDESRTLS